MKVNITWPDGYCVYDTVSDTDKLVVECRERCDEADAIRVFITVCGKSDRPHKVTLYKRRKKGRLIMKLCCFMRGEGRCYRLTDKTREGFQNVRRKMEEGAIGTTSNGRYLITIRTHGVKSYLKYNMEGTQGEAEDRFIQHLKDVVKKVHDAVTSGENPGMTVDMWLTRKGRDRRRDARLLDITVCKDTVLEERYGFKWVGGLVNPYKMCDEKKVAVKPVNVMDQPVEVQDMEVDDSIVSPMDVPGQISEVCDGIKTMLLDKNRKYGNSALDPQRVFSKSSSIEQLKVRIDDKLSRIKNMQSDEDEDVYKDLAGYLVLLMIAMKEKKGA